MRFWHKVEHWFRWNKGRVKTWWEGNFLYVGFKCSGCGKVSGVEKIDQYIDDEIAKRMKRLSGN